MGSNCSSRQAHKDKDNNSPCSEDSPCYQLAKPENNAGDVKNNHRDDGGGGAAHPDDGRTFAAAVPNKTNIAQSKLASKEEKQRPKEPPLSAALLKFPAHLANLLTGRALDSSKPLKKTHKIALYVCAADSQDCCVEKGALHNVVYPELRAVCRGKGYELHIVDLHWKTALEKQQDHEFPELCLGELARQSEIAYVIPIIFLNDSLGTPLLPKTIEKQDFEFALNSADNKELLQKWYKLDSHAQPPCYRLQPIGSHIPGVKDEAENEVALNEWRLEIERILAVMVEVFPAELRNTYLTTVVEQEVHNTVLMSQELAKRSIWVWRTTQRPDDPPETSTVLLEQRRRLEILQDNLKGQLAEKHIFKVPATDPDAEQQKRYAQDLAEKLDAHLRTTVSKIISEDEAKDPLKPSMGVSGELFQELAQQANYCQRAAQCNINREEVIQHIKNYILGSSVTPLVLHGPKGCGKSALVAKAFQAANVWQPEAYKIIKFTGLTPASGTMEQLLLSIITQCSILAGCEDWFCAHNVSSYGELLPKLMSSASSQNPLIIMIDGIDQVRNFGSQSCEWLPESLPQNLKLILSVDEGSEMFNIIKTKVSDPTKLIQVPQLGKTEAKSILMSAVVQYNHSINKQIQDFVRNSVMECTLPLYIKILSWQTSLWVDKEHTIIPKGNVKDQFHALLQELEAILGQVRIKKALSLISASKFGLCDSEMLDLLAQDSVYHSEKTYVPWAPACLFWAQLNKYLAPFLEWTRVTGGYCVRRWRDISFQQAVSDRYMDEECTKDAHLKLEAYFRGEWALTEGLTARIIQQPNKDMESYNIRKLVELPYQTFAVSGSIEERFLLDHLWLLDKVCGANVYQVLEDFALEESEPESEAAVLRGHLEASSQALSYDGHQLWAQLHLRLSNISTEGRERLQALKSLCAAPPDPSLLPLGPSEPTDEPQPINFITRLPEMVRFVCTLAAEKGEIVIWDVCTGQRVRTLTNVPQPAAIKLIDWRRCIVLCRRELTVFDLDKGELVKRLKGVMNQKMPYFGLHDEHHLVALSRNRMYINLMNLETGDCVTTFKAGEDRFLDSLLVSKDGRILVCGDETQKPFPLLVWNLTSRKLMYDLRIPHHDFVTSLAAITDEGHYVCSVCKEVDEPSPNFIIVYDLQSGTLFKKWKPGVNTVSIAISSSQDKFVISGHEDAQILVWDLTTGNCRHTLCGHTAPVTMLRLDSTGSFLLSTDSLCRDRSLRLWNLSSGTCIAVFTPDHPFTACELANGGRAVMLALKGQAGILTLHLKSGQDEEESQEQTYGDPEMGGQVVSLNDEDFR